MYDSFTTYSQSITLTLRRSLSSLEDTCWAEFGSRVLELFHLLWVKIKVPWQISQIMTTHLAISHVMVWTLPDEPTLWSSIHFVYITLHRQFDKSKQDTNTRHYTDLHCWSFYFSLSLYSDTYLSMRSCLSLSSCLSRSMRSFSIRSILSLSMRSLSIISRSLENKCPNKSSLFLGSRYWGGMGIEG